MHLNLTKKCHAHHKPYSTLNFSPFYTKQKISLSCRYMVLSHTIQWILVKAVFLSKAICLNIVSMSCLQQS